MYYFLLPIPEFPPLGGCKKMQIPELTLSPLKVERYATVKSTHGECTQQNQTKPKAK